MTVEVTLLPDLPVIYAVFHDELTVEGVKYVFRRSAELAEGMPAPIYRASDIRNAKTTFSEMMAILHEARGGSAGAPTDPRFLQMFIGNSQWLQLARDALEQPQFGGVQVPMFPDLESALEFVRADLARRRSGKSA